MEDIISYLAEYFIPKLFELKLEYYKNPTSLADFAIATKEETDKLGREILQASIVEMDRLIKELPARKRKWVVEHKADGRQLLTTLGRISFSRVLYKSKTEVDEAGKPVCSYLLDNLMGLSSNQEMAEDVMANIYQEAVQTSYRKAGEEATSIEGVSKQTVKNQLHKLKFPKSFQIPEVKKVVDYLYIDADEDHYHLQFKEKRGDLETNEYGRKLNGGITKLAYVFEDIEPEAPKSNRNKLVGTHYFSRGYEQNSKEFWAEVFEYVEATYDTTQIKKIYINADGGAWIKSGYRGLADVTFVLDEFHLSKYVLKMTGHMKDSQDDAIAEIYGCIRSKKKADFLEVVEKLKGCTDSEKIQAKIDKAAQYISSNWTAAKYRLRKSESVKACSAEGHVYHVLSSRMSTQAMGWSKLGAGKMAHLREYYYNNGDMLELAKFQKEEMQAAAGAEEVVLSASAILASEKGNRSKMMMEYGKYSERIHSTLSLQNSKQLMFYLNGKI